MNIVTFVLIIRSMLPGRFLVLSERLWYQYDEAGNVYSVKKTLDEAVKYDARSLKRLWC